MNRRTLLLGIGIAALAWGLGGGTTAHADGDEIAVIVHKNNGVGAMNRSQLSALFKAKSTQFPGGARATPVNLSPPGPATCSSLGRDGRRRERIRARRVRGHAL